MSPQLEDQYKTTIHELVKRVLELEKWKRNVTGDSPLFDIANEHTPNELGGDQNDYDPGFYDVLRINSGSNISITGIARGQKGRFLEFINVGTGRITFPDESASSLAENRIATPYNEPIVLLTNARARFYYDSTSQRWTLSDAPSIQGTYGRTAFVSSTAPQTIHTTTETQLTLMNSVLFDEWGYWDAVNSRFLIPAGENGIYLVGIRAGWNSAVAGGTLRQITIQYNGNKAVGISAVPNIANIGTNMEALAVVRMVSGDFVNFYGRQDSVGDLDIAGASASIPIVYFSKLQ